ncbi:MAG TPA: SDR family oxidoreductase [Jiangellaceae bacterium]
MADRRRQVVLITGANRGIGRHLAVGLAEAGHDVALLGRRADELDAVASECAAHGVRTVAVTADVVDGDQVGRAVAEAEHVLGGIDLLINNAGVIEPEERPFADTDIEAMWRVVEVNVRGSMLVTHAVLPGMLDRGAGRIININSGAGYRPMPAYTGYAMAKGAIARLTTLLDAQYREQGIRAFDLAPGQIETDMTRSMPMHEGRTEWTDPKDVVALAAAVADGSLDDLAGRFFRADIDTPDSLRAAAGDIIARDARTLGMIT